MKKNCDLLKWIENNQSYLIKKKHIKIAWIIIKNGRCCQCKFNNGSEVNMAIVNCAHVPRRI